jgi:hypothetical protein
MRPETIRKLITPMGGCIASNRITVDGAPVGMMLREAPDRDEDSGWQFLAGDESQEYLDDPGNSAIYEVNTIANHDPAIIPYLYAVPGQRFDRDPRTGGFVEAPDSEPDPEAERAPRGVDVVFHHVRLGDRWAMDLPTPFRRRFEDGGEEIVLWRPCLTFWISTFDWSEPVAERLQFLHSRTSPAATDVQTTRGEGGLMHYSYRLREDSTDAQVASLYLFVVAERGHVQIGTYADREEDIAAARAIVATVRRTRPGAQ